LVGPRPPLPCEVEHYDDYARRRLSVNPGITCYWQIGGRSNVSFDEWMQLDNRYIDDWTPLRDFEILARTIPAVIRGEGAH
ncbi:MAG: sugar transferase, partial [Vulcanimicrobiaceae bacterium]